MISQLSWRSSYHCFSLYLLMSGHWRSSYHYPLVLPSHMYVLMSQIKNLNFHLLHVSCILSVYWSLRLDRRLVCVVIVSLPVLLAVEIAFF